MRVGRRAFLLAGLVGALLLGLFPTRQAAARGAGVDFWVLDRQGKPGRKWEGSNGDLVDLRRERTYRPLRGRLSCRAFGRQKPLWEVACDIEQRPIQRAFLSGDVLLLLTPKVLVGVDVDTGRERFRVKTQGLFLPAPYNRQWRVLREVGPDFYLVRHSERNARGPDGAWLPAVSTAPPVLHCFDLRTGKLRWRVSLGFTDPAELVDWVAPGLVVGRSGYTVFFDPQTGAVRTGPTARATSSLLQATSQFLLTHESAPRLMAWSGRTGKLRWQMPWRLAGYKIVAAQGDRVWLSSGRYLFLVDGGQGRVLMRLEAGHHAKASYGLRVHGVGAFAFTTVTRPKSQVYDWERRVTAYRLPAGERLGARRRERLWAECPAEVLGVDETQVLLAHPRAYLDRAPWGQDGSGPYITAVGLVDKRLLWRFAVPPPLGGYSDSATVDVHTCRSGYLVIRAWTVLD